MRKELPHGEVCFVCSLNNPYGLKLTLWEENGKVYTETKISKYYSGYKGVIHGGIISTLLDEVMFWACYVKAQRSVLTVDMRVRFRKILKPSVVIRVEGWVVGGKRNILKAKGILKDSKDSSIIYAEAEGTYIIPHNLKLEFR